MIACINNNRNKLTKFVFLPASLIVVLFWFYYIFKYTSHAPINDDFDVILSFLLQIEKSNYGEITHLLFEKYNEHILLTMRLIVLALYKFLGYVDMPLLALLGNISLLGIAGVFFLNIRGYKYYEILFFAILLLIFQFSLFSNSTRAMAAISNYYFLFFSFFSFYLADKYKSNRMWLLILCSILALFSQGGGVLTVLIISMTMLYKGKIKSLFVYSLFLLPALGIFFANSNANGTSLNMFSKFLSPLDILKSLAFFMGSFTYLPFTGSYSAESFNFKSMIGMIVVGFILILYFIFLTLKKYYKKNLCLYSLYSLIILLGLIVALTRGTSAAPRYYVYPILIIPVILISMFDYFGNKNIQLALGALLLVGLMFNIYNNVIFSNRLKDNYIMREAGLYIWDNYKDRGSLAYFPQNTSRLKHAEKILSNSISKGIFRMPKIEKALVFKAISNKDRLNVL